MKNHGRVDPDRFQPETLRAMLELRMAFQREPGLIDAQVTVNLRSPDEPPYVHLIVDPDPQTDWPGYWYGDRNGNS